MGVTDWLAGKQDIADSSHHALPDTFQRKGTCSITKYSVVSR